MSGTVNKPYLAPAAGFRAFALRGTFPDYYASAALWADLARKEAAGAFVPVTGGRVCAVCHTPPGAGDVTVEAVSEAASGDGLVELPAHERAVWLRVVGPYSQLQAAYTAAMAFAAAQGLEPSAAPREFYLVGPAAGGPEAEYVTDVCVPVAAAQ